MKRLMLSFLGFIALGFGMSINVLAGSCVPLGGSAYSANYNHEFSTTEGNQRGQIDSVGSQWGGGASGGGNTYSVKCQCNGTDTTFQNVYYTAKVLLTGLGSYINNQQFYTVSPNLEVAMQVYIGGGITALREVPFKPTPLSNNYKSRYPNTQLACLNHPLPPTSGATPTDEVTGFMTGASGVLTMRITNPFVGEQKFSVPLLEIYGTTDPNDGIGYTPMSRVTLVGDVSVKQGCNIDSDTSLTINFGNINRDNFVSGGIGNIPTGTQPVPIKVMYNCSNMSNGIRLSLTLKGVSDPTLINALKTDNNDVAIMIDNMDKGGKHIPQNATSDADVVDLNYNPSNIGSEGNLVAMANLQAYPVSVTGKPPSVGSVTAITTLVVNIK